MTMRVLTEDTTQIRLDGVGGDCEVWADGGQRVDGVKLIRPYPAQMDSASVGGWEEWWVPVVRGKSSDREVYVILNNSIVSKKVVLNQGLGFDNESTANWVTTFQLDQDTLENNFCSDYSMSIDGLRLYIICGAQSSIGSTILYELSTKSGVILSTLNLTDQVPVNSTRLATIKNALVYGKSGLLEQFVIVYDRGDFNAQNYTDNQWLILLQPNSTTTLLSFKYQVILDDSYFFSIVYDYHAYLGNFMITHRTVSGEYLSVMRLGYCGLNFSTPSPITMNCTDYVISTNLGVKTGYAGFIDATSYAEISLQPNSTLATQIVCSLVHAFTSQIFTYACQEKKQYFLDLANRSISSFERSSSINLELIRFAFANGSDAGVRVQGLKNKLVVDGGGQKEIVSGVLAMEGFVLVNRSAEMQLYIDDERSLLFGPGVLPIGSYVLNIQCSDGKISQNTSINMSVLQIMPTQVELSPLQLSQGGMYYGESKTFPFNNNNIYGNDVTITAMQDTESSLKIDLVQNTKLDITFDTINMSEISDIKFAGPMAIIKDHKSYFSVFICEFTSVRSLHCTYQTKILGLGLTLAMCDNPIPYWLVCSASSSLQPDETKIVLYHDNPVMKIFYQYAITTKMALVYHIAENEVLALYFISRSGDKILSWTFINNNGTTVYMATGPTYTANGYLGKYCFVDIKPYPTFPNPSKYEKYNVAAVSNCGPSGDALSSPITVFLEMEFLYSLYLIPVHVMEGAPGLYPEKMCWTGTELVYLVNSTQNGSIWSSNIDDTLQTSRFGQVDNGLEIGYPVMMHCVGKLNTFVGVHKGNQNGTVNFAVYRGEASVKENWRVVNTFEVNVEDSESIQSHDFMGNVIHWVKYKNTTFDFYYSYIGTNPMVINAINQTCPDNSTTVAPFEYLLSNKNSTIAVPSSLTLTCAVFTPQLTPVSKATLTPNITINLEPTLQIIGPVSSVSLSTSSDPLPTTLTLLPRLTLTNTTLLTPSLTPNTPPVLLTKRSTTLVLLSTTLKHSTELLYFPSSSDPTPQWTMTIFTLFDAFDYTPLGGEDGEVLTVRANGDKLYLAVVNQWAQIVCLKSFQPYQDKTVKFAKVWVERREDGLGGVVIAQDGERVVLAAIDFSVCESSGNIIVGQRFVLEGIGQFSAVTTSMGVGYIGVLPSGVNNVSKLYSFNLSTAVPHYLANYTLAFSADVLSFASFAPENVSSLVQVYNFRNTSLLEIEYILDSSGEISSTAYVIYNKLFGYDGYNISINEKYIAHLVQNSTNTTDFLYTIYSRSNNFGGNGYTFSTLQLTPTIKYISFPPCPTTSCNFHLIPPSSNSSLTLTTYTLSPLSLTSTTPPLPQALLLFTPPPTPASTPSQSIELSQLVEYPVPPGPTPPPGPPPSPSEKSDLWKVMIWVAVICAVVGVVAAVGLIAVKKLGRGEDGVGSEFRLAEDAGSIPFKENVGREQDGYGSAKDRPFVS